MSVPTPVTKSPAANWFAANGDKLFLGLSTFLPLVLPMVGVPAAVTAAVTGSGGLLALLHTIFWPAPQS